MSLSRPNRGKDFEDTIKKAFEKVPNVSVDRLHDQMTGYKGSSNICDFIVYHHPLQLYIECKATYGNTLSIYSNNPKKAYGDISNTQWEGLLEKEKIYGVAAGYIIWYIDYDETYFIPAHIAEYIRNTGNKSINRKYLVDSDGFIIEDVLRVYGDKKRIFFDYNMKGLLNDIKCLNYVYDDYIQDTLKVGDTDEYYIR